MLHEFVEPIAVLGGGGDHLHARSLEDDLPHDVIREVRQVGFGNDHQRCGP
ncbi:hypothetical protein PJL18_03117 [Paenarthrobacter nicotinovorans]|nr:hypothetical protein [Paenarthrobacter nicotinovorans]